MGVPATQYATTADGLTIAYQVAGSGPPVVLVPGTASHVELFWDLPGWAHLFRSMAAHHTAVWFDKRGAGLSERTLGTASLEARMEDIRAVMDAVGLESATLVGMSESGPICATFAASFPERTDRLVMAASFAHDPELGQTADLVESSWGDGRILENVWARGVRDAALLGRIERAMGTPKSMAALIASLADLDARPVLPLVTAPSLVVHCKDDPIIPARHAREVAALLPDATLVEVEGHFHGSGRPEEMELYTRAIRDFIAEPGRGPAGSPDRVLATVLFTDIVRSTDRTVAVGDSRWAQLLDDHDRICARAVEAGRGRIVKSTGDGILATFDGPATAITAAVRLIEHLAVVGLHIRVGIHTGEIERRGDDIGGIGVNLAARVMQEAGPDEVLVSSTVPGLTVGADVVFEPRGPRTLKGIPGEWDLYAATIGVSRPG